VGSPQYKIINKIHTFASLKSPPTKPTPPTVIVARTGQAYQCRLLITVHYSLNLSLEYYPSKVQKLVSIHFMLINSPGCSKKTHQRANAIHRCFESRIANLLLRA